MSYPLGTVGGVDGQIRLELVRHECRGRWRRTELLPRQSRGCWVRVGVLGDGRWYVDVIKPDRDDCRLYADEQAAWRAARAQMVALGGSWEQVPCYPTGAAQPSGPSAGSSA